MTQRFEDANKATLKYFDRMLSDFDFYEQEIDNAPDNETKNKRIKNVEAYARYKEKRPSRLSPEGASLALMGAGDELGALSANIINKARNVINPDRADVLKDRTYEDFLENIRDRQDMFREDFPIQGIGTEVGGGVVTAIGTGGTAIPAIAAKNIPVISQGARALSTLKQGATVPNLIKQYSLPSLLSGGAFGFAEGEGGIAPRAKSGAVGGAIGGVGGTVLGGGVNLVKGLANVLSPNFATRSFAQRAVDTAGGFRKVLSDIRDRGRALIEQDDVAAFARQGGLEDNIKSDKIIKNFLKDKKADQTKRIFGDVLEDSGATGNKLPDEGIFEYQDRILVDKVADKNAKYAQALLKNNEQIPISNEMRKELDEFADSDLFDVLPDYVKRNVTGYVDRNGKRIFNFVDGKLQINSQQMTLTDAEALRRAINRELTFEDAASPNLLKLKKGLEADARKIIDKYHADIIPARKANELMERESKIYNDVLNLFKDKKQSQFFVYLKRLKDDKSGLSQDEIMNIVKRAALTNIDDGATSARNRATYLNRLVEEDSATQTMLKRIFPAKEFDDIMEELSSLGNTNRALFDFTSAPIGSKRQTAGQGFDTGIETLDRAANRLFNRFGLSKDDQARAAQILIDTEGELLESVLGDPDAPKILAPLLRRIATQFIGERSAIAGTKVQDVPLGIQPKIEELYEDSALQRFVNNINEESRNRREDR